MYTYYTKVFTESLFENISEWLNTFAKPEHLSHIEHNMDIINYTVIPGNNLKGSVIVITIRVFTSNIL